MIKVVHGWYHTINNLLRLGVFCSWAHILTAVQSTVAVWSRYEYECNIKTAVVCFPLSVLVSLSVLPSLLLCFCLCCTYWLLYGVILRTPFDMTLDVRSYYVLNCCTKYDMIPGVIYIKEPQQHQPSTYILTQGFLVCCTHRAVVPVV